MEQKEVIIPNVNLPLPEYNYQVVYYVDENRRIVFIGVTDLTIDDLLSECDNSIDLSLEPTIESVSYSPVKLNENGSEK